MGERKIELNKVIAEARAELWALEAAEKAEQNRGFVGRFFKCSNSYSCPASDADRWWLYTAVTSIDADGELTGVRFQIDQYGNVRVEREDAYPHSLEVEIDREEYEAAVAAMQAHVAAMFEATP